MKPAIDVQLVWHAGDCQSWHSVQEESRGSDHSRESESQWERGDGPAAPCALEWRGQGAGIDTMFHTAMAILTGLLTMSTYLCCRVWHCQRKPGRMPMRISSILCQYLSPGPLQRC